jgi:hypothetical protein
VPLGVILHNQILVYQKGLCSMDHQPVSDTAAPSSMSNKECKSLQFTAYQRKTEGKMISNTHHKLLLYISDSQDKAIPGSRN